MPRIPILVDQRQGTRPLPLSRLSRYCPVPVLDHVGTLRYAITLTCSMGEEGGQPKTNSFSQTFRTAGAEGLFNQSALIGARSVHKAQRTGGDPFEFVRILS
jgi:hypothetical protein